MPPTDHRATTDDDAEIVSQKSIRPLIGLTAGAVLGLALNRHRWRRQTDQSVTALENGASEQSETVTTAEFTDLPSPVRRYFETVLEPGLPRTRTARLAQTGEFRLGDAESTWHPFTATQHYSVDPPGFVWAAQIRLGSLLPVQIRDAYVDGVGSLSARALWTVTLADAERTPELDAAELSRYLAEAVWFPTALLPASGVEWTGIDDTSALATLSHRGTTVSMTVHFDDDGLIRRVVADRPRAVENGFETTRWTGYFGDYDRRGRVLVPTRGRVEWTLPDGPLEYWRATITDVEHHPVG
ncbi:DUF6544 family protein [Haloarcula marina]|uniref:DUF6544 family protein n=1 Tax=Haloarcula marina TaxID=2961574 RepID=UPI0020B7E204|nr:DUF6544 family protein [Halomicroarcula marina]